MSTTKKRVVDVEKSLIHTVVVLSRHIRMLDGSWLIDNTRTVHELTASDDTRIPCA